MVFVTCNALRHVTRCSLQLAIFAQLFPLPPPPLFPSHARWLQRVGCYSLVFYTGSTVLRTVQPCACHCDREDVEPAGCSCIAGDGTPPCTPHLREAARQHHRSAVPVRCSFVGTSDVHPKYPIHTCCLYTGWLLDACSDVILHRVLGTSSISSWVVRVVHPRSTQLTWCAAGTPSASWSLCLWINLGPCARAHTLWCSGTPQHASLRPDESMPRHCKKPQTECATLGT